MRRSSLASSSWANSVTSNGGVGQRLRTVSDSTLTSMSPVASMGLCLPGRRSVTWPRTASTHTPGIRRGGGGMVRRLGARIVGCAWSLYTGKMSQSVREVDPGELRLPPSRASGADPWKLHQQIRKFGSSKDGMPPLFVYEDLDGVL